MPSRAAPRKANPSRGGDAKPGTSRVGGVPGDYSVSAPTANEAGDLTFTITRAGGASLTAETIYWSTEDATATANVDYVAVPSTALSTQFTTDASGAGTPAQTTTVTVHG